MSRSSKHKPILGITTSESEKKDKRFANRKLRRKVKVELEKDKPILSLQRELSNVWSFGKDGKKYWRIVDKKYLRK